MITAVFLPQNVQATEYDLQDIARNAIKAGLQLYTNGRLMALLPRPLAGWRRLPN